MGSETQKQIPKIDLSKEIERGSEEWNDLCKRVTKACEEYGCFEVIDDIVSTQMREQVFSLTKELFELPLVIKKKNANPKKPYMAYAPPSPDRPLLEGFGIEDASNFDSIKAFSQALLSDPIAQNYYCQSVNSMVQHQNELYDTIWSLIFDSFGIEKTEESAISSKNLVRLMKYELPRADGTNNLGIAPHTDGTFCTMLCEHNCSGLEIQVKDSGEWIPWIPNPHSHIFIVGDPLVAWSNGRFHAVRHRVTMRGNKNRYSLANFVFPDDDVIFKPQKEFIDENHPQKFKSFVYSDYAKMVVSSPLEDKLHAFAGI